MLNKIHNHLGALLDNNKRVVKWSASNTTKKNIGDALNPFIFERIFNKRTINIKDVLNLGYPPVYSFIGSVLDNSSVKNLIVVGSGFKSEFSKMNVLPSEVIATRGPLTRKKLLHLNLRVPEIYGDPAILLPRFYNPDVSKNYKIGLIPHYVDKDLEVVKFWSKKSEVKMIDVFSNMEIFVNDLKSCDFTISSSLHGVILSHSYGIPSVWIKLSNKVDGDGFKFYDYYQSLGINIDPVILEKDTPIDNLKNKSILPDIESLEVKLFQTLKSTKI